MRLFRPPLPAKLLYPEAVFRIKNAGKVLCLTFDDGPDPESTEKLLAILDKYSIKAVFFCNGEKAEMYPLLMNSIRMTGHTVGNHGYSHIDGWVSGTGFYVNDINRAGPFTSVSLFRPPYGRMSINQYRILKEKYKIVMWDLMPYDFDVAAGAGQCLGVLRKKSRAGSLIVLHDTRKSLAASVLEDYIIYALTNDYRFENPFNK